ncbi:hypothetical protein GS504_00900 [Rhodococcus hoagii]|nr:hypothetical protein [Prescottella equi]NKS72200.1 hypothetical protein [Prescottella equi]
MIAFLVVAAIAVIFIKIISRILRVVIVLGLAAVIAWYVTGQSTTPAPAPPPPPSAVAPPA